MSQDWQDPFPCVPCSDIRVPWGPSSELLSLDNFQPSFVLSSPGEVALSFRYQHHNTLDFSFCLSVTQVTILSENSVLKELCSVVSWLVEAPTVNHHERPTVSINLEEKGPPPKADIFPKGEKMAFQDKSAFVFMLNWTNIWIRAVCGSHGAISFNSKEMASDSKSSVAASDVPGDSGRLGRCSYPCPPGQSGWQPRSVNRSLSI